MSGVCICAYTASRPLTWQFAVREPAVAVCPQLDTSGVTVANSGIIDLSRCTSVVVSMMSRPSWKPL